MAFGWKLVRGRQDPAGGRGGGARRTALLAAAPIGLGAQHVVAMFGATFVFPLIMGLDPNLAIMMSGVATIVFLLIVQGEGAQLPRHQRRLRRRRRRDPGAGR